MRRRVEIFHGSLLDTGVDAWVNAGNPSLGLGSGVSAAIQTECGGLDFQKLVRDGLEREFDGELPEGECLVTGTGTSTRARYVLHVAAVDYKDAASSQPGAQLAAATPVRVRGAVAAALERGADLAAKEGKAISLAFPLLGAGHGGLPESSALNAFIAGLRAYFKEEPEALISRIVVEIPEDERFARVKRRMEAEFGLG